MQEHPVLVEMSKRNYLPIVGFNWKEVRGDGALDSKPDTPEKKWPWPSSVPASCWRAKGNPYQT